MRIAVVGHVDHGKSTLAGRLLVETGALPEGKLEEIRQVSERRGLGLELAFALDALQSERNQGITIDAAHVWLGGRTMALVDAPGHEEFLRNMVTGASTADAAMLVIDALEGLKPQTQRHAYLLRLLGVEQVVVVVNKMDLIGWDRAAFEAIAAKQAAHLRAIGIERAEVVPISARDGANVARRAPELAWWTGPVLLDVLRGFKPRSRAALGPLRFAVQDVYKLDERRVIAGRIESGTLRVGDEILFSPWNKTGFVATIERWSAAPSDEAVAGESVGITLDRPLFVERGQLGSHRELAPIETDVFDATIFWLGEAPLETGKEYRVRIATQEAACRIEAIRRTIDVESLESGIAVAAGAPSRGRPRVERGEIAEITLRARAPVALDDAATCPQTGRFVLLDGRLIAGGGVASVGAGLDQRSRLSGLKSEHVVYSAGKVSRDERARRTGHRGRVVWLTGLPSSGKSTVAAALERALFDAGWLAYLLDGDNLRHGLSADLGFAPEDRAKHVRRVAEVAKLFCDAGLVVIVALISPAAADRTAVRQGLRAGDFVEVHVDCPVETCERRDPKGLYKAAREGRIRDFTGVDAPYEAPLAPEVVLRTAEKDADACAREVMAHLRKLEAS